MREGLNKPNKDSEPAQIGLDYRTEEEVERDMRFKLHAHEPLDERETKIFQRLTEEEREDDQPRYNQ